MPPNQALPRIRGETVIRVTKDFGDLIKQAAYTEALIVSFTTKKNLQRLKFLTRSQIFIFSGIRLSKRRNKS